MPLVPMADIVTAAAAGRRGVGAFNAIQLEHAEGIVTGAEAVGSPVVLQVSQNAIAYHGAAEPIIAACLAIARAASVPVCVHLDHATDVDLVDAAVALGVRSVMFDASALPYKDNVARTARTVAGCHGRGVWVEAELGEVGGKDGVHAPGARTDPAEAATFTADTGVDALAVAVGTSHAMTTRRAILDTDLIGALRAAVPVPLVLHGSSGVPDDGLAAAVRAGITKVNIATQLNKMLTREVRAALHADVDLVDPRVYLNRGRVAVAQEVSRLLTILSGAPAPDLPAPDLPAPRSPSPPNRWSRR